jgi:hypothetical protein
VTSVPSPTIDEQAHYRVTAFGLTIEADWPLAGSVPASRPAPSPASKVTRVKRLTTAAFDDAFAQSAERILAHRGADGAVSFTADRSAEHYRFWLEGFGRYLVAVDGGLIACELGAAEVARHERFVLAHALPVASVLQGYEVLHASAIAAGGGAAAFAGASGTGKTRMASRLVARGASFLTDDVLAVETAGDHVRAHPGPAFMSIRPDDTDMLAEIGGQLGADAGSTDKVHVTPPVRGEPSRLRAVYHIQWGDTFQITPLAREDFNRILSLSFVPYLATPDRLMRHLAIAQVVSVDVAQFWLQTPGPWLSEEMLGELEGHLRDTTA